MKQIKKVLNIVALCLTILFFSKNANAQCSGFNVTASQTADGSSLGDVTAQATVTGSSGSVTYVWYTSSYSYIGWGATKNALSAGTYCVIAEDSSSGNFCKDTFCLTIIDTGSFNCANFQSSINSNDSCQYNDINFYSSAWGGSGSYSYLWSTGQTSQNIYNKAGGTYSVIITDIVSGCKDTLVKTEIDDTCNVCSNFNNSGYISENDVCAYNDITLTVQKWGGSYNYSYLWNTGATTSSINNRTTGSYSCIVTDNIYGCKDTLYITVADDTCNPCANFQANIYEINDSCELNDIKLSAYPQDSLGSTNYTYLWNTGATNKNLFNKTTGLYWVRVTNAVNGCVDTAYITVSDDTCNPCSNFQSNIYSNDSCLLNDINFYVSAWGGSGSFSYLWSTGQASQNIYNKSGGTYTVIITDLVHGCKDTLVKTEIDDTCNVCSTFQVYLYEWVDGCGLNDLKLIAYPADSLNSSHYSYIWSTGSNSALLTGTTSGAYWVKVTNNITGCFDTAYITVSDDTCNPCANFQANAYKISDPCGLNNVTIAAFPYDSMTVSNYSYLWNTGATSKNITGKTTGSFWVLVTNLNTGCIDTAYISVVDNNCNPCTNYSVKINKIDSCKANDLDLSFALFNGSGSYSILWNTGSTAYSLLNQPTGVYKVTVTDLILGCVKSDSIYAVDSNYKCCSAYFWVSDNGTATKNFYSFNDSTILGSTSHNWTFGNGNNGTGSSISQTYTAGGVYTVCHMINTPTNCKDTFCLTVNAPNPGKNLKVTHYGNCYVKDTNRYLYINYQNIGTTTENGIVEYKYPAGMTLVYSNISPTSNVNNILSFNVGSLAPGSSGTIFLTLQTPISFVLGSIKCDTAIILPITGDIDASNNTSFDCDSVKYSNDPNEKMANPSGIGEAGNIDPATKEINYLINFQNEGNYRTFRVRVEDEIDPAFDINSLMIGDVSHTYRMVKTGRKIVWNFDNIELTPKSQNEKLSKGYVQYTLKLNSNLPLGTQIKNTAYIYFDANPAIITNTTKNTLKNADGNAAVSDRNQANLDFDANKLDERVVITSAERMDAVRIYDLNGKLIVNTTPKSMKSEINAELMSKQVYIIQVDIKESTVAKKFEF